MGNNNAKIQQYTPEMLEQSERLNWMYNFVWNKPEEEHDTEVERHLDRPLKAVLGHAVHPRMMLDRDFRDARPVPEGVDGDEAVHLAVERDALQHLPPVGLQRAAVIVELHPGRRGDETVCHAA